jgi:DNA-binding protein
MADYLHQKHGCISRAVDNVELLRRALSRIWKEKNIAVGTEEMIRDEG